MWLPVHGPALPLPRRSLKRCGVRQFGPKPSALHVKCSTDVLMAWILLNAGPEGVIEYSLARCELTRCAEEERHWLRFCKLAVHLQNKLDQVQAELVRVPEPMTWMERRQILVEREQQRRNRSLERSWAKPSTNRVEVRQLQVW